MHTFNKNSVLFRFNFNILVSVDSTWGYVSFFQLFDICSEIDTAIRVKDSANTRESSSLCSMQKSGILYVESRHEHRSRSSRTTYSYFIAQTRRTTVIVTTTTMVLYSRASRTAFNPMRGREKWDKPNSRRSMIILLFLLLSFAFQISNCLRIVFKVMNF